MGEAAGCEDEGFASAVADFRGSEHVELSDSTAAFLARLKENPRHSDDVQLEITHLRVTRYYRTDVAALTSSVARIVRDNYAGPGRSNDGAGHGR